MTQKIWTGQRATKRGRGGTVEQRINETRLMRNEIKAVIGARQYRKQRKQLMRAAKAMP